jgi:hypothetical protein
MNSFHVESCRRIKEGDGEFIVRMLSGRLAGGDRFGCQDGMGHHVLFRVRSVEAQGVLFRAECEGPIAFDGQFAGFTIVTTPFPPSRSDLPMPARKPEPTERELAYLKACAPDWNHYHPLQQAVVLCVVRGKRSYEKISDDLSVNAADIESACRGLGDVVLRDSSTGTIYIK